MKLPLDLLDAEARRHDLHLVLEHVTIGGKLRRWKLGVIRPRSQVRAGARALARYEGMSDVGEVQDGAHRLLVDLHRTPPRGGS